MKKRSFHIILSVACIIFSTALYAQAFNKDKWYRIMNPAWGQARSLAISEVNGAKIIYLEASSNHLSQYWKIVDQGKLNFRLVNMETGNDLCLDMKKDGHQTYLSIATISETGSQYWKIFEKGNGYYNLINRDAGAGRSLDISYQTGPVKLALLSNTDPQRNSQLWQIQEITAPAENVKPEIKGPDGFSKGADEDGSLNFNFKADVAYGVNGIYIYKYGVTGAVNFNNATFGDPAPGFAKAGFYKQVVNVPPVVQPIKEPVKDPVITTPDPVKPVIDPFKETVVNISLPKSSEYVRITNKIFGDRLDLDYNDASRSLSFQLINHGWKLEPVVNSSASQFKILVNIKGKDWALTADKNGNLKLSEKSSADGYQYWNIERQTDDGYYRITNSVLFYAGAANSHLFCSEKDKKIFLTAWDAARSLNGRWLLHSYGMIPKEPVDELDNKKLELLSTSVNKSMCYETVYLTDYGTPHIIPCTGKIQKLIFKKTINGEYLIAMEAEATAPRKGLLYLDWELEFVPGNIDPVDPMDGMTWKIEKVSNLYYKISNGAGYMELVQGASLKFLELKPIGNKIEQMWYFR